MHCRQALLLPCKLLPSQSPASLWVLLALRRRLTACHPVLHLLALPCRRPQSAVPVPHMLLPATRKPAVLVLQAGCEATARVSHLHCTTCRKRVPALQTGYP